MTGATGRAAALDVTVRIADLDTVLGPAADRFFGEGHRAVRAGLDLEPGGSADRGSVGGRARVEVGERWSVKAGRAATPHLSTLDALRLTQLACAAAQRAHGLRLPARVARLTVRTGSGPTEERMDDLPVRHEWRRPEPGVLEATTVVGTLGTTVRLVPGVGGAWDEAPHPARRAVPRDLLLTPAGLAEAALDPAHDPVGAVRPWTLSECFVAVLQLGQVLLQDLDQVPRGDSGTLWMRGTGIGVDPPGPDGADRVHAHLERARLVTLDGAPWRCADVVGRVGTVGMRCAVTHRLPR